MFGNAAQFSLAPYHESGGVLQKEKRDAALIAEFDEMRALQAGFREEHAVIGDDPHGKSLYMREAADQRVAPERLELMKCGAIDQPGDHLALIAGAAEIGADDAGDLGRII